MLVRLKYVNLLLTLALLAGQVQYVHTTFFCTEQHAPVSKPTVKMQSADMSSGSTICDECRGMIPVQHGATLSSANRIQITTRSKDIVSGFTLSEKLLPHFEAGKVCFSQYTSSPIQHPGVSVWLFNATDFPPLPLHVLNLSFRI